MIINSDPELLEFPYSDVQKAWYARLPVQGCSALVCSVPILFSHPHTGSRFQTLTARATVVGQQRMFSRLRGWRRKLVNTSLYLRGAIGADTNCDDFKVGAVHYELAAFFITPKMSLLNLILCCASVVTECFFLV